MKLLTTLNASTVAKRCFWCPVEGTYEAKERGSKYDALLTFEVIEGTVHASRTSIDPTLQNVAYCANISDLYNAMVDPKTWDNKGGTGWISEMTKKEVLHALTVEMSGDSLELILDCLRRIED